MIKRVMPKRSKEFGVGKVMGDATYVHISAEDVLPQPDYDAAQSAAGAWFRGREEALAFNVVKLVRSPNTTPAFTLIHAPMFDTEPEPKIISACRVCADVVRYLYYPRRGLVYHHKWLMVREDYAGFDVRESKLRSERILNLPQTIDFARIGQREYWEVEVLARFVL